MLPSPLLPHPVNEGPLTLHSPGFRERLVFRNSEANPPAQSMPPGRSPLSGGFGDARVPEDGCLSMRHAWLVAEVCNLRVKIAS